MEGVGARLGRSSSRYGTTTVFNGPVRKWKKDWVPVTPPPSSSSSSSSNHSHKTHHHNNHNHHHNNNHHQGASSNGSDVNSVSHLRLFKWTPLNKDNGKIVKKDDDGGDGDEDVVANGSKDLLANQEELPVRKKFKYIPIAVLEEQKKETEENSDDDEAKPADSDEHAREQTSKSDGNGEKPDINDVPMEDNEADEENQSAPARQDLNELDLSLGFTSHDDEQDSDSKMDTDKDV